MTFDAATIAMLKTGIWETFYMVFLSSLFAYLIGLPWGSSWWSRIRTGSIRSHGFPRLWEQ